MWTQLGRNSFQKRTGSARLISGLTNVYMQCTLQNFICCLVGTLSESKQHEAETMLSLKTNKIIQDKLVRETSKAVILKDVSNTSTRKKSGITQNDLQESIKRPTDKYGELLDDTGTHILNITDSKYELQAGVTMLTKTLSYGYETTSEAS